MISITFLQRLVFCLTDHTDAGNNVLVGANYGSS